MTWQGYSGLGLWADWLWDCVADVWLMGVCGYGVGLVCVMHSGGLFGYDGIWCRECASVWCDLSCWASLGFEGGSGLFKRPVSAMNLISAFNGLSFVSSHDMSISLPPIL